MEKDGAFKQRLHAHLNHPGSHGFNAFLKEQQALPDEAIMSFIQFDSQDPHEVVHHFKPINDISLLFAEKTSERGLDHLCVRFG